MTRIFKGQGYTLEYIGHEQHLDKVGWKTAGSAGFDLVAAHSFRSHGNVLQVGTGVRLLECDPHLVGLLFLRSSAALRYGMRMSNSVAVIDSDYRGEICLLLDGCPNLDEVTLAIAQLVFVPFAGALVPPQVQRAGGFGSTDK